MQQSESMETQASQGVAKIDLDFSRPAKTFVPIEAISACTSYRDAVRLAWDSRAHQGLTQRFLGVACALYAPHVSDYLAKDAVDSKGNRAVSQYLMRKAMLTIMEEVIAARAA